MGRFADSGIPHEAIPRTKNAHLWNEENRPHGIAWEANKILCLFRDLPPTVAVQHR
jgi:hypothetical protein